MLTTAVALVIAAAIEMWDLKYEETIVSLPILARNLLRNLHWDLGEFACKFTSGFTMINLYASVWFLVAMTFDRYFTVCKPIKARSLRNRKNVTVVIVLCWVMAVLLAIPAWLYRTVRLLVAMEDDSGNATFTIARVDG